MALLLGANSEHGIPERFGDNKTLTTAIRRLEKSTPLEAIMCGFSKYAS